jgi:lipopolysaccharide/colanic/teichoic acid biosynthesis glycosyltransferase
MVKPGITGWAQINYPYGASIEDARTSWNTISITPRTTPRSSTC